METFYIHKIEVKLRNYEDKLELVKRHLDIDYLFLNTFEFGDRLLHFEKKINDLDKLIKKNDYLECEVDNYESEVEDLKNEIKELKQQINNLTNKN
jgi:chaperonin cofactor prefoldin